MEKVRLDEGACGWMSADIMDYYGCRWLVSSVSRRGQGGYRFAHGAENGMPLPARGARGMSASSGHSQSDPSSFGASAAGAPSSGVPGSGLASSPSGLAGSDAAFSFVANLISSCANGASRVRRGSRLRNSRAGPGAGLLEVAVEPVVELEAVSDASFCCSRAHARPPVQPRLRRMGWRRVHQLNSPVRINW